jgi:NADPH:quinone reductase-like Zn-dependent oxidoreductase
MRAAQFTLTSGGLDKNIKLNTSAPLPQNATSLPPDSTLVKVAYASPNPVDYKLPENPIFNHFILPKGKDGSAIPIGDFAGKVIATTLPNLKAGDRVFGRGNPPHFGALGEYMIARGTQSVVPVPDGVSLKDASTVGVSISWV